MVYKIIFTADLHGNIIQYRKLAEYSIKNSADCIIIGGDLAPKNFPIDVYIKAQREFLKNKLPELLHGVKKELANCKIFLMMGNDDCKVNLDVLQNSDIFQLIHNKRAALTKKFDIMGYAYVPITPFGIKDWEKFDLTKVPLNLQDKYMHRKTTNYRLYGFKSTKSGWKDFQFSPEMEKLDSIQNDLSREIFQKNPDKTIYVIHTPPDRTDLDMTVNGNHVGSMAVRLFIEKTQPYVTLHGHIHETVDVSGEFKQKIGNTLCLSSGNTDLGDKLAIINVDVDNTESAERIII